MAAYLSGGNTVGDDATNLGASWTKDELDDLRNFWRYFDLRDIALHLGRTEQACVSMYYSHLNRPEHERWQPAERTKRAMDDEAERRREDRPVNTIHDDEDRWWEADYYRDAG